MSEENWTDEHQPVQETAAEEVVVEAAAAEESSQEVAERTGNPQVDEVLESLEALDDTPVDEQVAVFEAAHEKLRSALADAGNEPPA